MAHSKMSTSIDIRHPHYTAAEIQARYLEIRPDLERLCINLQQAFNSFFSGAGLQVLSTAYRVKDIDSCLDKVIRKGYPEPFAQIEDLCGIRIICYYQSDLDRIAAIIKKEFQVLQAQSKDEQLEPDRFGYRSIHYIVKIKKSWVASPNYRNLGNIKVEIQLRTVLMHAWAEIQHKLAYKKKQHIPNQFIRKLSTISAKLEEADQQFDSLRAEINAYKKQLARAITSQPKTLESLELNLDNLQLLLNHLFPERDSHIAYTRELLNELVRKGITIKEILRAYKIAKPVLSKVHQETFGTTDPSGGWNQFGAVRTVLDLTNREFFLSRKKTMPLKIVRIKQKWIKILKST